MAYQRSQSLPPVDEFIETVFNSNIANHRYRSFKTDNDPSRSSSPLSAMMATESFTIPERKQKRQSRLTKMFTPTPDATTTSTAEPFSLDYFPKDKPRELEALQSCDVERITDGLAIQLQTHYFTHSLDRRHNGQLARVLESHAELINDKGGLEIANQGLVSKLEVAHATINTLETTIENLKELYLTEIKRMEKQVAKDHGLEQVTLLRRDSVLHQQERVRPSTRRRKQEQEVSSRSGELAHSAIKRERSGPAWARSQSPSRVDAALTESILGVQRIENRPIEVNPFWDNFQKMKEDKAAGEDREITEQSDPLQDFLATCLPNRWSSKRSNRLSVEQESSLLNDEKLVLAMKTEQTEDARTVRRLAEILHNRKRLDYNRAMYCLVRILFGRFDIEAAVKQAEKSHSPRRIHSWQLQSRGTQTQQPYPEQFEALQHRPQQLDPQGIPPQQSIDEHEALDVKETKSRRNNKHVKQSTAELFEVAMAKLNLSPRKHRKRRKSRCADEKQMARKASNSDRRHSGQTQLPASAIASHRAGKHGNRPLSFSKGDESAFTRPKTIWYEPLLEGDTHEHEFPPETSTLDEYVSKYKSHESSLIRLEAAPLQSMIDVENALERRTSHSSDSSTATVMTAILSRSRAASHSSEQSKKSEKASTTSVDKSRVTEVAVAEIGFL